MRNWSGKVVFHPARVARPGSDAEVAEVLRAAGEQGLRVRPVGAAHSFTPLMATGGVALSLDRLTGVEDVEQATGEVWLRGGTRIREIAGLLAPHRLALPNMGDIDAQAIAGAVSTGTHGTGLAFTGYSGIVTGLRLALPSGEITECSRTHQPELFEAARVGFGAFGVILAIRLACVPAFALEAVETTEPAAVVLESFLERARAADHLEFFWFPGTLRVTVKHNRRLPAGSELRPMSRLDRLVNREFLGNTVFEGMCRAAVALPALARPVGEVGSRLMAGGTFSDSSHRVYVAPRRVRFHETEFAMPLDAFPDVVVEVERAIVASGLPITFPIEVRVAAADDTWLGTSSGQESVYVAVHRYHREPFEPLAEAVWPVFRAFGGRPHWGKDHDLGAEEFAELYPRFVDAQRVRAQVDPDGLLLNDHLRKVFGT
ncbi:MAG TPA: FAD-binding protein [Actinomycetales bacterium]|nr:FAD-binding protein [Actinomycetales bacterium]